MLCRRSIDFPELAIFASRPGTMIKLHWLELPMARTILHGPKGVRATEVRLITKTRLHNFDPLKPHFYIVKLGFTGVYFIFLISAQNIDCGYSLEPPRRGGCNEYPQSMFCAEIRKNIRIFYLKVLIFWW